ncbi:MAG: CTP synthase [Pseudobdellovibrionaceae bacterium]
MKKKSQCKFIFVTGGVVSSIGKGLTAASLGALLEARGYNVNIMKFDPYLNIDPGTMSPFQHGEVFVTEDGAETDLDLGHYERFTSAVMQKANSVTAGQIYDSVLSRERRGDYLGGTVQVIPHITDEIKSRIYQVAKNSQILLVEIGGTVGDIEGQPFLEAIRQVCLEVGSDNSSLIHVTYVPYIAAAGELKSKPTQHSVKELRSIGLQADFLVCRSEKPLDKNIKAKLALFGSLPLDHIIAAQDASTIYQVPLVLKQERLDDLVCEQLKLKKKNFRLQGWKKLVHTLLEPKYEVKIGVVGKYVDLQESYKSLHEALVHGGVANNCKVKIVYIDSEKLNPKNSAGILKAVDAILVPGGFGIRGVEGKIAAIRYARENQKPFFGICFGMQLAAIEFARHVCDLPNATSREFTIDQKKKSKIEPNFVIDAMIEQVDQTQKGGTMRLGAFPCDLKLGSLAYKVYGQKKIQERHRHRFEFNNQYKDLLQEKGLVASGICKSRDLVEILELTQHPWFIGVQFHPEFKSQPLNPHPLFESFVSAALKEKK